jgi:methyl coenzyme M reductase alpha subunit
MLKYNLTDEDLELLDDALDDAITVAEGVLEIHIESDQTPETIEEFMEVVSDAQDHLTALKTLQQKLRG